METMVFFTVERHRGLRPRRSPESAMGPGQSMRLYANLDHMHLIDPVSEQVL